MIDNAEDHDIVTPIYNLLEYTQNYSMKSASLWNYYISKINDVDDNASDTKSFRYRTKIVEKTTQDQQNQNDRHNHFQIQMHISHHDHPTTITTNTSFKC